MNISSSRFAPIVALTGLALVAGCGGGGAELEDTPEAEAFLFRQAVMRVVGYKMVPIGAMARGEMPVDVEVFTEAANQVATMSDMTTEGFDVEGIPTGSRAMPEIWTNWSDFEQKAQAFQEAAHALADAAESGGFDAAQSLVQPLVQTCGGCHRSYRAPEE